MQLPPANFVAKEVVQLKGLGTTGPTLPFEGNRLTVMALPVKCFQDAWPGRSLRNPYKNNVLLMNEGHHLTRPMKAVSASQLDKLRKPVETTFHNNFEVALDFLQTQSIYWLKEIIWDISFSTNYIYIVESDEIEKPPSLTFRNQSLFQDFRKLNLALAELAIIPVVQNSGVHFYILRSEERCNLSSAQQSWQKKKINSSIQSGCFPNIFLKGICIGLASVTGQQRAWST